jgi:hypothetical protein
VDRFPDRPQPPVAHRPEEVGVVADPDDLAAVAEPHRGADARGGLDDGRVDPAVDDPVRLVQCRRDVPDDDDAVRSDLLEPQTEKLEETARCGDGKAAGPPGLRPLRHDRQVSDPRTGASITGSTAEA